MSPPAFAERNRDNVVAWVSPPAFARNDLGSDVLADPSVCNAVVLGDLDLERTLCGTISEACAVEPSTGTWLGLITCKLRLTAIPPGIIPLSAEVSPPAFAGDSTPMSSMCNEGPVLFPTLVLDCAMAACL